MHVFAEDDWDAGVPEEEARGGGGEWEETGGEVRGAPHPGVRVAMKSLGTAACYEWILGGKRS